MTEDRNVLVSGSHSQRSAEIRVNDMLAVFLMVWLGLGTKNTWIGLRKLQFQLVLSTHTAGISGFVATNTAGKCPDLYLKEQFTQYVNNPVIISSLHADRKSDEVFCSPQNISSKTALQHSAKQRNPNEKT